MHASNIQLVKYILTDFNYSANADFEREEEVRIELGDFAEEHEVKQLDSDESTGWYVELKLDFTPTADQNAPYSFSAKIVGFFRVNPKLPEDKVETYIETNATSVLYSTLREIVSTITAKGPYSALLLPTVSFYESSRSKDSTANAEDAKE